MTEEAAMGFIRQSFCEVMEKQVFMVPEPCPAGIAAEEDLLAGTISFSGRLIGSLLLAMPATLAREIAANFLGVDADDDEADLAAPDALKEMLNITCGNMLTALSGTEAVFDLTIPEVAPLARERVAALASLAETLVFEVEGFAVLLRADLTAGSWTRGESREA